MSKSSMLKEGMKGGLNGLLSSTKKPSKEQIVTETTPAPPVSVSETTEVPVHCNFLIGKSSVRCPLKPSDSIPLCPNNPAH